MWSYPVQRTHRGRGGLSTPQYPRTYGVEYGEIVGHFPLERSQSLGSVVTKALEPDLDLYSPVSRRALVLLRGLSEPSPYSRQHVSAEKNKVKRPRT